jgi:lipoprotein-anchoring transpeptidase ErfK/SrfK
VQILLDRARFSPGVIDGQWGKNTEKAVYWFQFAQGVQPTGEVDKATLDALVRAAGPGEVLTRVSVTPEDLKGPFVEVPKDPYEQARLDCLCYASPLELFAERGHASPELVQKLNPQVDFANLSPGTELVLPQVPQAAIAEVKSQSEVKPAQAPAAAGQVTQILISKQGFYLQALDSQGHILYHFPSTLGSKYDPSATGTLQLTGIHPEPDFHYQPTLFADMPDNKPEAHLPAGPNSPVGLVWMALSKPHHGIHGTATPETIGYTSSHGCVRLTNWDALILAQNVRPGTPVMFRD